MTPTDLELADLYDRAADVLDERGWCRGNYESVDGQVCLVGAVRVAAGGSPRMFFSGERDLLDPLYMGLAERPIDLPDVGLTQWNDEIVKDKRTVQRFLRRVARNLREGAQ